MAAEGASFLETPTYWIAFVLFVFLAACLLFERALHFARKYLKKHNKHGLLAAVEAMGTEVMLLGFVSLLLTALEGDIAQLCVPATGDLTWILAGKLSGCPCCIEHTKHLTTCYLRLEECGTGFCNCDHKNESCLTPDVAPGYRHLLAEPGQAETVECVGYSQRTYTECGDRPGYAPAVSVLALHEIHLLLFFLAIIHIAMSCLLVLIASWRVRSWHGWEAADDAHAKAVRQTLDAHHEAVCQIRNGQAYMTNAKGQSVLVSPTIGMSLSSRIVFVNAAHKNAGLKVADADVDDDGQVAVTHKPASLDGSDGHQAAPPANADSSDSPVNPAATATADRPASGYAAPLQSQASAGAVSNSSSSTPQDRQDGMRPSVSGSLETKDSGKLCQLNTRSVDPRILDGEQGFTTVSPPNDDASHPQLPHTVAINTDRKWLGRTNTFKKKRQHLPEIFKCFWRQYHPNIVTHEEFAIMRASFILTHRQAKRFNFIKYISESMEDDYAEVVGLGIGMWVTVIVMVAVAGPIGWPVWWALLIDAVVLHVVNTKLIKIIRHVTRGGAVHRLAPNIFWFHKPWLLLPLLKTLLFINSFIFSSTAFFASQFGPKSCFFTSEGYKTTLFPLPWWLILVANTVLFAMLATNTLPLYSLAVQMGSDYKHHMVPQPVKDKLRDLAARAREKTKQKERSERGSIHRLSGVSRLVSGSTDSGPAPSGITSNGGSSDDLVIDWEEDDVLTDLGHGR